MPSMSENNTNKEKPWKINLLILIPALATVALLILSFDMLFAGDSNTALWFLLSFGMAVVTVFVWKKLIKPLNYGAKFKLAFMNDDDYENDRLILKILDEMSPFSHVSKNIKSNAKEDQYQACHRTNHNKLKKLVNAGADIVIACGADPVLAQGNAEGIDVLTSQVIIQKRANLETRVLTTATSLLNIMQVQQGYEKITQRRQVDVATQTTLGGILGGSTGAIIGAANAIQQNDAGGEKNTTGLKKFYGLQSLYGFGTIDTIYISTALIKKIGDPPKHFVVSRTDAYWVLEDERTAYSGNGMIGGYDGKPHEELVNYIVKAMQFYFDNCKYKNGSFLLK